MKSVHRNAGSNLITNVECTSVTSGSSRCAAGVEMRKITDAHTPSGRTVNSTLYYVLASFPAPLLERRPSGEERRPSGEERARLESSLNYADHCFSGHATMHAENLWPERLGGAAHIPQLVTLWTLTLQKRGCRALVAAGAHGAMQAMVLSFGGLQFTENHLQFQADPDVLHNSYALRGIHYNQVQHHLDGSGGRAGGQPKDGRAEGGHKGLL